MPKARVYELAKELGVDSKTVLSKLEAMGKFVKSASSTVEPPVARKLRNAFASSGQGNASDSKKPGHTAKKPAEPASHSMPKPAAPSAPKPAAPAAPKPRHAVSKSDAPKPGHRALRPGESRQHGNRPNGNAPRPQGGDRRQSGRPTAVPGARPQHGNAPQGGNNANGAKPHTPGPRPGNNPFSRKQGMHTPTPGDIPRPHPMNRPSVNNGEGRRGGRPGQGGGQRGGFRGRPGQGGAKPGQWGQHRPGQGGGQRPAGGGNRFGGNGGGFQGGNSAPSNGPARGGRGRGGAAGAFGRQGGKSSKARKNRLAKRQEFQEMKAPVIGGVRIPTGNGQEVRLRQGASLADLAEKINVNPAALVTVLFHLGEMATATQSLDEATFQILGEEIGWNIKIVSAEEEDKELLQQFDINLDEEELQEDEDLKPRPPVVTVMGHVDHGKTRLLDTIRRTNVIEGEAGGITQRIGAYQVTVNLEGEPRKITFLDTPGHEAFTAMRARGAELTDVAILVVAADDGVMPQTVEAINHAQAAHVPIVVAVNKIDKPGANPDRVRQELTEYGIIPEEWGGQNMFVNISAKQKIGIDDLLETVLLQADVLELNANPDTFASGNVLEAKLDKGRGSVATVLVTRGTLRVGDTLVAGLTYGRVRAMLDPKGNAVTEAGPSDAVEILGLQSVPNAGDEFRVFEDEREARALADERSLKARIEEQSRVKHVTLENLFETIADAEVKELNLIIKADVQGSIEALQDSLDKMDQSEVRINTIHSAVGAINETDVVLADASNAIIIGFGVRPDGKARSAAEREGVEIRCYDVIYKCLEDLDAARIGMLKPTEVEVSTGTATVLDTFKVPKVGIAAGVRVEEGEIAATDSVRLVRDGIVVFNGKIASMRHYKDEAKSLKSGSEGGIGLENFQDIKPGDTIEGYRIDQVARTE